MLSNFKTLTRKYGYNLNSYWEETKNFYKIQSACNCSSFHGWLDHEKSPPFARIDADKDGFISYDEKPHFLTDSKFKKLDIDDNNQLSISELVTNHVVMQQFPSGRFWPFS